MVPGIERLVLSLSKQPVIKLEPLHEKTKNLVSEQPRSGTNPAVQAQKMAIEAGNFGFRKQRNCTQRLYLSEYIYLPKRSDLGYLTYYF